MYKKIIYLLSTILGIFLAIKLVKKLQVNTVNIEYTPPQKEQPELFVKRKFAQKISRNVLNERQREILKLLEKRQILLPSDIYSLHPQVSTRTLRRDMTSLVELNIVKQEGSTRDTKYVLIT